MSRFPVFARLFVLTFAVLLAADACSAQERGRGRRGFGGFGGRDGMFNKSLLLRSSQVQGELKLSDSQKSEVDTVAQESLASTMELFQGFRDLSDEEREAKRAEISEKRNALEKATNEKIAGILDDAQEKRLNEIQLQVQGPSALTNLETAAKLNLTAEQKQKITDLLAAQREVAEELTGGNEDLSREERRAKSEENRPKLDELRKETEQGVVATLTDAQKEQWNQMKGAAFELDRSTFQFGGRGGFGGRSRERDSN